MSSSIEERLSKLQTICEDRMRQTASLRAEQARNATVLAQLEATAPRLTEVARVNLNLAQHQFEIAQVKEGIKEELSRQDVLREQIERDGEELEEAIQLLQDQTSKANTQKRRLQNRETQLAEHISSLR
ncbi:hypothetical protein B484DRAFT_414696 [Ochromonadaceae sp. CCMP2298]|nr:hypothetical protein B484DRAFT_414696 [Ochromonadaceae sp. CCMP2298]